MAGIVLMASSMAWAQSGGTASISGGTITVARGEAGIVVPISVNFSAVTTSSTNAMDSFDLAFPSNSVFSPSTTSFAQWIPGTAQSPTFDYLEPGWSLTSNGATGYIDASAGTDPISNASSLGTVETLDLLLNVNGSAPLGLSQVSIDGRYNSDFDLDQSVLLAPGSSITVNVVPEPATFSLLAVALGMGGGFLAVRRRRRQQRLAN
jgi:hypothetical protein